MHRFYGRPKIHKPGVPICSIVSYTSSLLYNLKKYIANILKAYIKDENSYASNSTTFSKYIRNIPIEDDEIMVSSDVTALYTHIPIIDTLNIIKDYVNNDDQFIKKTTIPQGKFLDLVHLVLPTTCYTFNSVLPTNWCCCHGRHSIFNHSRNLMERSLYYYHK